MTTAAEARELALASWRDLVNTTNTPTFSSVTGLMEIKVGGNPIDDRELFDQIVNDPWFDVRFVPDRYLNEVTVTVTEGPREIVLPFDVMDSELGVIDDPKPVSPSPLDMAGRRLGIARGPGVTSTPVPQQQDRSKENAQ